MDRGVPAIFATASGEKLAQRVIHEFNGFTGRRRATIADDRTADAQRRREANRLDMIMAEPMRLGRGHAVSFGEGELRVDLDESVREQDVFLIQNPYEPPSTEGAKALVPYHLLANVQEGIIFADALKQCSAASVALVSPYLPFSRQDHTRKRESLTAATYAKQLHATGLRAVITVEVHSRQHSLAYEAMNMGFENLRTGNVFIDAVAKEYDLRRDCEQKAPPNLVIVSPDAGGIPRARYYAKRFGVEVAWGDKRRDYSKASVVTDVHINGEVKGKEKVVVDDMIASGGSMYAVADKLFAVDEIPITLVATHPLLTGEAVERFDELYKQGKLRALMTMDTITRPSSFREAYPWYLEISCAPMIARTIYQMNMSLPVSDVHEEPC